MFGKLSLMLFYSNNVIEEFKRCSSSPLQNRLAKEKVRPPHQRSSIKTVSFPPVRLSTTVIALFLSVTLCNTRFQLLLVFSLWNGVGQSQFTLLSRIGCNSLLVVDSPFVYELNSCTFISGAPPYSFLLQNKRKYFVEIQTFQCLCFVLNLSCTVYGHQCNHTTHHSSIRHIGKVSSDI